jgi:hypothetical protein
VDGWTRSSRTVGVSEAQPALREAFRRFGEAHSLDLAGATALETKNVRGPGFFDRWFGRDTASWSLATVLPGLVVWAVLPERATEATALAARLADVTVEKGMGGRIAAIVPNAKNARGVSFTGVFVGRGGTSATAFLGWGPEPDGPAFERRLREAMRDAGNPLHGLG